MGDMLACRFDVPTPLFCVLNNYVRITQKYRNVTPNCLVPPLPQQPCSLLVIDEDSDFVETVTRRYERRGFAVEHATSAAEASAIADERRFSIVLLRLSATTAHQLAMLEASHALATDCQVIAIATREQLENASETIPEGVSDCFVKPLIWGELDWRIFKAQQRFLDLRHAEATEDSGEAGIGSADLQTADPYSHATTSTIGTHASGSDQTLDTLAKVQRAHILEVLKRERGNKARTARALGVNRRSLYRLIEKFQIAMNTVTSES